MKIKVHTLDGTEYDADPLDTLVPDDPILAIKYVLKGLTNIPVPEMNLFKADGTGLYNGHFSLADYGVQDGEILTLVRININAEPPRDITDV